MMEKLCRTAMLCLFILTGCVSMPEQQEVHLGVVDYIAEGTACILIGPEETDIRIPIELMPADTAEGDWFIIMLSYDPDITYMRRKHIAEMLEAISKSSK